MVLTSASMAHELARHTQRGVGGSSGIWKFARSLDMVKDIEGLAKDKKPMSTESDDRLLVPLHRGKVKSESRTKGGLKEKDKGASDSAGHEHQAVAIWTPSWASRRLDVLALGFDCKPEFNLESMFDVEDEFKEKPTSTKSAGRLLVLLHNGDVEGVAKDKKPTSTESADRLLVLWHAGKFKSASEKEGGFKEKDKGASESNGHEHQAVARWPPLWASRRLDVLALEFNCNPEFNLENKLDVEDECKEKLTSTESADRLLVLWHAGKFKSASEKEGEFKEKDKGASRALSRSRRTARSYQLHVQNKHYYCTLTIDGEGALKRGPE